MFKQVIAHAQEIDEERLRVQEESESEQDDCSKMGSYYDSLSDSE